jgi:hypothetical protein
MPQTQQILVKRSSGGAFSSPPLWKRWARGDFSLPCGSIVVKVIANDRTSPHRSQIPLNPPFPKGEGRTTTPSCQPPVSCRAKEMWRVLSKESGNWERSEAVERSAARLNVTQ